MKKKTGKCLDANVKFCEITKKSFHLFCERLVNRQTQSISNLYYYLYYILYNQIEQFFGFYAFNLCYTFYFTDLKKKIFTLNYILKKLHR